MEIKDLLTPSELEILLDALRRYATHCKSIADRPVQGYGRSSELDKKNEWKAKCEEIEKLELF